MTHSVGAVLFEDETRLYIVFDSARDAALRPLFTTEETARAWLASGMRPSNEPANAAGTDEAVTLIPDISLESLGPPHQIGGFASRASRTAMWLTGARSFLEMAYANGATASRAF